MTLDSSGALILERHYFAAATATCYPSEQKQQVLWRQNCNLNGLGSAAESQNSDLSPSRDRMRVRWAQTSEITKSMWSTCCFFTYTNYCWYPFDAADLFAASPLFLFFPDTTPRGSHLLAAQKGRKFNGEMGAVPKPMSVRTCPGLATCGCWSDPTTLRAHTPPAGNRKGS